MTTVELIEELKSRLCKEALPLVKLNDPALLSAYAMPLIGAEEQEHFLVLTLNHHLQVLAHKITSIGSVNETIASPRDVFRFALSVGGCKVVLFHNHPSGDTMPSDEDIAITKRMIWAGEVIGVEVVDHIVVSSRSGIPCFTSIRRVSNLKWWSL